MVIEYFLHSISLKLMRRYAHPGAGLVLVFLAPVRGGQGLDLCQRYSCIALGCTFQWPIDLALLHHIYEDDTCR